MAIILSFISSFYYSLLIGSSQAENGKNEEIHLFFQGFFMVDTILKFFVEIPNKSSATNFEDDDIVHIALAYLRGGFLLDFAALAPLKNVLEKTNHSELFYLPKLFRLRNGFALLNYKVILRELKMVYKKKL